MSQRTSLVRKLYDSFEVSSGFVYSHPFASSWFGVILDKVLLDFAFGISQRA